jgi:hypothetical protein
MDEPLVTLVVQGSEMCFFRPFPYLSFVWFFLRASREDGWRCFLTCTHSSSVPETLGIGTEPAEDSPGGMWMSGRSSALLRTKRGLVIAVVLGFGIVRLSETHFSSLQWHPPPSGEAYAEEMDQ